MNNNQSALAKVARQQNKQIVFKPVYGIGKLILQPPVDATDRIIGAYIPTPDEERYLEFYVKKNRVRVIEPGTVLDLNNIIDAMDWGWISKSRGIALTREEAMSQPDVYFYVYDESLEQQREMEYNQIMIKALNYVNTATEGRLKEVARMLEGRLDKLPIGQIQKTLFEKAKDSNVNVIYNLISVFEDPDAKFKILIHRLTDEGIIKNHNEVYRFDDVVLGINFDQAVAFLQSPENKDIMLAMDKRLSPHRYDANGQFDVSFIG